MSRVLTPSNTSKPEPGATELYLRIGKEIFGVSFTDLADAQEAARHINLSGRDVEIYEKNSGKVVELSKGAAINPLKRPAPPYFVVTPDSKKDPRSLPAAE